MPYSASCCACQRPCPLPPLPQGFISRLIKKENYGFIESEEHDCEIFFPFTSIVDGDPVDLCVLDEVEYCINRKEGKARAERVVRLAQGTIAQDEVHPPGAGLGECLNGEVVRVLRSNSVSGCASECVLALTPYISGEWLGYLHTFVHKSMALVPTYQHTGQHSLVCTFVRIIPWMQAPMNIRACTYYVTMVTALPTPSPVARVTTRAASSTSIPRMWEATPWSCPTPSPV